jgi:AraC family transcriptional regulator of adaptative response / methylphosphotriester-DNA alkyltransferase methyltransferase
VANSLYQGGLQSDPSGNFAAYGQGTLMREGTAERREQLYREAMELITREYMGELNLDGVARRLATSRRQLQRAFAETAGVSFRTFVAQVRMRKALELLQRGHMPVREVANAVGYRQPAQFAKTFRRHHGAPPSSFRGSGELSPSPAAA